jgi:HK97 gp10 family phage protein
MAGTSTSVRFAWNRNLAVQLEAAIEEAMEETGAAMVRRAREVVPVRTGRLRDSIHAAVEGGSGHRTLVLAADAPYADFIERGTSRHPAKPYIRPAVDAEGPKLGDRIRAHVGRIR